MVGRYKKNKTGLYILSKDAIDMEAEYILQNYCKECLIEPKAIDIEELIEKMGLNLCYAKLSKNSEILGAFVFNSGMIENYNDNELSYEKYKEKTIIIDATIADNEDARLKFTYGHELGHYVTQYDLFHIDNSQLSLFNNTNYDAIVCKRETADYESLINNYKSLETKEDWQEWQANYFSSCILIPKATLKIALKPYLENYNILDTCCVLNKLDKKVLIALITKLSLLYKVSYEMMEYRLKNLKYLE